MLSQMEAQPVLSMKKSVFITDVIIQYILLLRVPTDVFGNRCLIPFSASILILQEKSLPFLKEQNTFSH